MGTLYPKVKAMVCLVLISMISTTDSLRAGFRATAQEWKADVLDRSGRD